MIYLIFYLRHAMNVAIAIVLKYGIKFKIISFIKGIINKSKKYPKHFYHFLTKPY